VVSLELNVVYYVYVRAAFHIIGQPISGVFLLSLLYLGCTTHLCIANKVEPVFNTLVLSI